MLRVLQWSRYKRSPLLAQKLIRTYTDGLDGSNKAIIEMLTRNMHEEDESTTRNAYKVRAFTSAIKVINQLDHPLRSVEEARHLRGVGAGIARRIEEHFSGDKHVVQQGRPSRSSSENISDAERRKAVDTLQLVTGVGATKARNLVAAGCMSISDMRKSQHYDTLTSAQKIGLRFVDQLPEPVTREQAETVLKFIQDNIDSKFEMQLGGSYRRGADKSGDMDIIIFNPTYVHVPVPQIPPPNAISKRNVTGKSLASTSKLTKTERATSVLYNSVVHPLEQRGLIAATLGVGARRWQGVVRLPERDEYGEWGDRSKRVKLVEQSKGIFRRMDLNLVPWSARGASLLALTGDVEFNRDTRIKASDMGMHLNELGLWRWSNGPNGIEGPTAEKGFWELVKAETEEEILSELGMEFVEPTKRNFGFVVGKKTKETIVKKAKVSR